jgi:hypothetical protein
MSFERGLIGGVTTTKMQSNIHLCTAEGRTAGVIPGPYPEGKKDAIVHSNGLRTDIGIETSLTLDAHPSEPGVFRLSYHRSWRGKQSTDYLCPWWGTVGAGQRLCMIHNKKHDAYPNRWFRMHPPLRSGGFYITTFTDDTLYVGMDKGGYLALTTSPFVWFSATLQQQ